jgi:hypothetical protein
LTGHPIHECKTREQTLLALYKLSNDIHWYLELRMWELGALGANTIQRIRRVCDKCILFGHRLDVLPKMLVALVPGKGSPLLNAPDSLDKVLNRDIAFAGIDKHDARGRSVDVHAFRMTFASHLARAGVPLRTAQALMRHSDPKLTANVYTDVGMLDTAGAVESLPSFTKRGGTEQEQAVHFSLAPTLGKGCHFSANSCRKPHIPMSAHATLPDTHNHPVLQGDSPCGSAWQEEVNGTGGQSRTADLWNQNPAASSHKPLETGGLEVMASIAAPHAAPSAPKSVSPQTLAESSQSLPPEATSEDRVQQLAESLKGLSKKERALLIAAMLDGD